MGLHLRGDGSIDTSGFKIVYIAPMKALVAEMVGNFSARLEPYGMQVRELTGDMNLTKSEIEATQVRTQSCNRCSSIPTTQAIRCKTAPMMLEAMPTGLLQLHFDWLI